MTKLERLTSRANKLKRELEDLNVKIKMEELVDMESQHEAALNKARKRIGECFTDMGSLCLVKDVTTGFGCILLKCLVITPRLINMTTRPNTKYTPIRRSVFDKALQQTKEILFDN